MLQGVYPSSVRQRRACADRPCGTAGKCVVDAWMSAGNTYAPSAPSAPVPAVATGYVSCAAAEEEYWTDCSATAACVGSERLIASTCDGCALPPRREPSRRAFALAFACQPPSVPVWSYFTVASLCAGRPCRAFATGRVQCVPTLEHPDHCAQVRVCSRHWTAAQEVLSATAITAFASANSGSVDSDRNKRNGRSKASWHAGAGGVHRRRRRHLPASADAAAVVHDCAAAAVVDVHCVRYGCKRQ